MIFVDDCGTDDSMGKVRAAAAEDPRIRIIENEENIGAGPSRNKGIDAAQGEYLSFVDPDDYVAIDFCETLYREALKERFDIVKGSMVYIREDGIAVEKKFQLNRKIRNGLKKDKPLFMLFSYEHQSGIYKREFLNSIHARYGTSIRGQDTTFLLQACSQANSFSMADAAHYFLCERIDSTLHIASNRHLLGVLQSVQEKTEYTICHLQDDPWSRKYLQDYYYFALQESTRYYGIKEKEQDLIDYAANLRSIFMRLPYHSDLSGKSYSLYALQSHNYLLPDKPFRLPWEDPNPPVRYAKLVAHWIDYYYTVSEKTKDYRANLAELILRAQDAVKGKPSTSYSTEERRLGELILKEQLKRLPIDFRLRLEASMFFQRANLYDVRGFVKKNKKRFKHILSNQ
jgi:glycosyltransferase involved in cell wall biosynthesis